MIEPLLQAERLLLHGLVDQAEALYRRTLEADPRNAIALVGLARVALERGDDGLAYRQACLALEIDQRNPSALRLEARLSEVLAERGEPVERPAWLAAADQPAAARPRPAERAQPTPEPAGDADQPHSGSEQAVFTRNPSMADHREMESRRPQPPPPSTPETTPPAAQRKARRRGLLRRLLGR